MAASPKIGSIEATVAWRAAERAAGRTVVLTNGCFDVLHRGHVDLLREAKRQGDRLVVAANDDESIRRLKGPGRPLVLQEDRAELLAALEMVDRVVLFTDDTPAGVIDALLPDVLVKGADYALEEIVGRDTVEGAGGRVYRVTLTSGRSTRELIRTVLERYPSVGSARTEEENR
ncbi:MAG: hypothetical protein DHS20C21_07000 [Gemmatimonadota bacterium]|nr:MAG: hypothetical protein DHS20C21_07000 [Gemmatimonadota bacterium]